MSQNNHGNSFRLNDLCEHFCLYYSDGLPKKQWIRNKNLQCEVKYNILGKTYEYHVTNMYNANFPTHMYTLNLFGHMQ